MQVVGVDFGTSNVRIAQWDTESELTPAPVQLGKEGESIMPAVIAFRRQADGAVSTLVGEDADGLDDGPDRVVVRNIKRWALSGDPYVRWHLDSNSTPIPDWWNSKTRCVRAFDREIPVGDVVRMILDEAFQRAAISGDFAWRAGCPVHAGLEYRSELAQAIAELGGNYDVTAVVEEPILFLELAHRQGNILPGSYLVYDVGGGSFDCVIAEIEADGEMTVYASDGHPILGGSAIDELLTTQIAYQGRQDLLRIAKESLNPADPDNAVPVGDGTGFTLRWNDLQTALEQSKFIQKSLVAMRGAYINAKAIWKFDEQLPTLGDSAVPSLPYAKIPVALSQDLDAVILTGGPTLSPYFREQLSSIFGAEQVKVAADLVGDEISDPALTALSVGACYGVMEKRTPLYVRRLPARVTLTETTTGGLVKYEPYQHFTTNANPVRPFVSLPLSAPDNSAGRYEITIATPGGEVVQSKPVAITGAGTENPRLVIDRYGRVGIRKSDTQQPQVEINDPPWQTTHQRAVLRQIEQRAAERIQQNWERARFLTTDNPFGWQSGHA